MKGLSITSRGIEDVSALEMKEILSSNVELDSGCVKFDIKKEDELAVLGYLSQSSERFILFLDEFGFDSEPYDMLKDSIKKALLPNGKCKVLSIRKGQHTFNSEDIIRHSVGALKGKGVEIDFKNPDYVLVIYTVDNKCFLGIDKTRMDLYKREYKIFTNPSDIRATVAYAMVRLSGFEEGETLLDPFCNSGSVVIEASLYASKIPVRFYEKAKFSRFNLDLDSIDKRARESKSKILAVDANNRNVVYTRKNAKIAGVIKQVTFSRSDVEWMDTKYQKGCIDRIVSKLPDIRREGNKSKMAKIFDEFFYNSEYILKKKGKIVVMSESIGEIRPLIKKHGFVVEDEREVEMGSDKRHIYIMSKTS